jgi:methylated-DNA-[protein]-cysteine S-methyltransferase
VRRVVHDVQRYFRGERVDLAGVQLELDELTPFQRAIAEALRRIPWGNIVSYRDLARGAGYANAQRAAGTFCARNRYPLFLPCHRVVSANGLGGYGSLGAEYKRRLLGLEGVTV